MRTVASLVLSVVAVFLFAGCGAHGASSALPENASLRGAETGLTHDEKRSGQDLLYATERHDVRIYTYPYGKLVNNIKRRYGYIPVADCADSNGNVYAIFNFLLTSGNTHIEEYAHGGTKPFRNLFDYGSGVYDSSCSADPVSGDLAATGAHGYVIIWREGSASGKIYQLPAGFFPWACTYDSRGNLFVDGSQARHAAHHVSLVELLRKSSTFVYIELPRTRITTPAWIQWDGKYLAFGNSKNKIYRLAVSGTKARVTQTVDLDDAAALHSFWIQGRIIVGGGYLWNYPAGGKPIATIAGASRGVAVSIPPTR